MRARVLALVFLLAGCDASEPEPWVPTYDPDSREPVASTEFCSLLARNTCAVLRPCCAAMPFSWDEAKCRLFSRALCEARRTKSMELGLLFDDVQAGRCVRGTAILLPGCRTPSDDPLAADVREACFQAFHGSAGLGAPCDVKNPLACAPPDLGVRVTCDRGACIQRKLLQAGEECTGASCSAGLSCFGDPPRCQAIFHPLGAACTPASPEADRCDSSRDRFCSSTTLTCTMLPDEGEACDLERGCRRPWRCDIDRSGSPRCTDAKKLGEACNDDKECQSRLCSGQPEQAFSRICVPSGIGPPIAQTGLAKGDPIQYVSRIAAMCSGVIPEGGGSLAPFVLPTPR